MRGIGRDVSGADERLEENGEACGFRPCRMHFGAVTMSNIVEKRGFETTVCSARSGFTLVEVVAASAILVIAVAMALYGFVYAMKQSKESSLQNRLDIDVQTSMESLKANLRITGLTNMFFYPAGPGPYTAISIPIPDDTNSDGAVELNPITGKINWQRTIIYHRWDSTPNKLLLTTIDPRDTNTTPAYLQGQLNNVATNPTFALAGQIGTTNTRVLFANLFDWSVYPQGSVYDAYSASPARELVNFGTCIVSNGINQFQFIVTGSNKNSRGYKVGLDTLIVTPSMAEHEAELQITNSIGSPSVTNVYMANGSWSHNYQLSFPATATGQSFTVFMENDCWEESNFTTSGQDFGQDSRLVWDTTLSTADFVVALRGNPSYSDGWFAYNQANSPTSSGLNDTSGGLAGKAVRVLIRGGDGFIPYNAGSSYFWFQSGGAYWSQKLSIEAAYIDECVASTNAVPDTKGTPHQIFFGGSTSVELSGNSMVWAYCGPCASMHPIDKTKSYIISFLVKDEADKGYSRYWPDSGGNSCWTISGGTVADLTATNWSKNADGSANTNVVASPNIYAVQQMWEYYPTNGYYTSAPFDTHCSTVSNCTVSWTADIFWCQSPAISIKLRGANSNNMSDATAWTNLPAIIASGTTTNVGTNRRYLQFQAKLLPDTWCQVTPKLHHVYIDWNGQRTSVDVSAVVTKGPDYGAFQLKVNSNTLTRAVQVDMEIYGDVWTRVGTKRLTSALTTEVRPRNTGK